MGRTAPRQPIINQGGGKISEKHILLILRYAKLAPVLLASKISVFEGVRKAGK